MEHGTHCPIAFGLNHFGDRWTLLIIRDLLLKGRRQFREFLDAGEGIATGILTDRLKKLEGAGIVTAKAMTGRGNPWYYSLTPKGKDLLPVLVEMILWSAKHDKKTAALSSFVNKARKAMTSSKERKAYLLELLKDVPE
ncbi:MAG: helix-turn-helix domain-containing protein [Flavobacteriales bacterium]